MTDSEVLRMKLNLKDSVLDEKGKEEFLTNVEQFTNIFSLRDEIGTCPFIEVHLKLKDETPFFVRLYPMREEQKKVIQKEIYHIQYFRLYLLLIYHYTLNIPSYGNMEVLTSTNRMSATTFLSLYFSSKYSTGLQF